MRHRVSLKKLSKTPAHRKAMFRNMLVALYRHEKIKTTFAKSKVLQRKAEKLITRAKTDSVHNRRTVAKWVQDKEILNKLFTEIAPKFQNRNGGYTRIVKLGPRYGDATEMVYISLVEEELTVKKPNKPAAQTKANKKEPVQEVSEKPSSEDKATSQDSQEIEAKEEAVDSSAAEVQAQDNNASDNTSSNQDETTNEAVSETDTTSDSAENEENNEK